MEKYSIFRRSLESVKWIYGYTIIPKIISPVVQIILARLLVPSDFGLVAIASLIISFVEVMRRSGFSAAFIQSDDDDESLFNTVFWMSIGLGACFYFLIFLMAPLLADFFHNPESTLVIRIMGVQVILASINTCHRSSLIKNLEYKKIFKISLFPALSPVLITIPLAYIGFNVWALVIGYLSSSIIRTIALWYFVALKPLFKFNKIIAVRILKFGCFCSLEATLGWFYVWGDKAIVGHFLDTKQLGIYSMASVIVVFIFGLVYSPLSISYPLLCGLKHDKEAVRSALFRMFHIISSVSFLIGIFIFFNVDLFPYLLGKKWAGIGLPLGILAITNSFSYIVTITIPDALRAINRPDIMPKFQSAKLLYTLPAFIIGVKYGGLVGFCYAKLITVMIGFVIFLIMGNRFLDFSLKNILLIFSPKIIAFIATFISLIYLNSLLALYDYTIISTITNCISATIIYFTILVILDRKGLYDLLRLTKRVTVLK